MIIRAIFDPVAAQRVTLSMRTIGHLCMRDHLRNTAIVVWQLLQRMILPDLRIRRFRRMSLVTRSLTGLPPVYPPVSALSATCIPVRL